LQKEIKHKILKQRKMAKAGQELKRERKRKVERMMFVFEV